MKGHGRNVFTCIPGERLPGFVVHERPWGDQALPLSSVNINDNDGDDGDNDDLKSVDMPMLQQHAHCAFKTLFFFF